MATDMGLAQEAHLGGEEVGIRLRRPSHPPWETGAHTAGPVD
jgi:hypothetical protein